jgi:hypothetical protein
MSGVAEDAAEAEAGAYHLVERRRRRGRDSLVVVVGKECTKGADRSGPVKSEAEATSSLKIIFCLRIRSWCVSI